MNKVGLLTSVNGFWYSLNMSSSVYVDEIKWLDTWRCDGSRVQLPTGILAPNSCIWIVTDRGSELHNECSLLVFGHKNMVST